MNNKELMRNGSGCLDLTAYKAITHIEGGYAVDRNKPESGEIWTTADDKDVLVLQSFNNHSSVLYLSEKPSEAEGTIRVIWHGVRYTPISMISYAFNRKLVSFRRKIGIAEQEAMRKAVREVFGSFLDDDEPEHTTPAKTEDDNITQKIAVLTAERDCYKSLCELAMNRREGESSAVRMVKEK